MVGSSLPALAPDLSALTSASFILFPWDLLAVSEDSRFERG